MCVRACLCVDCSFCMHAVTQVVVMTESQATGLNNNIMSQLKEHSCNPLDTHLLLSCHFIGWFQSLGDFMAQSEHL